MDINNILVIAGCVIGIFILGKIFLFPLKKILKLVFNSILGGLLIFLVNLIGEIWGFHIGLNIITSIFVGVLGIPGVALLIIIKFIVG